MTAASQDWGAPFVSSSGDRPQTPMAVLAGGQEGMTIREHPQKSAVTLVAVRGEVGGKWQLPAEVSSGFGGGQSQGGTRSPPPPYHPYESPMTQAKHFPVS